MRVQIDPIADPNREIIEKIRSRMIILLHTLRGRSRGVQRRGLQAGADICRWCTVHSYRGNRAIPTMRNN